MTLTVADLIWTGSTLYDFGYDRNFGVIHCACPREGVDVKGVVEPGISAGDLAIAVDEILERIAVNALFGSPNKITVWWAVPPPCAPVLFDRTIDGRSL
jgi:hypothetical protein